MASKRTLQTLLTRHRLTTTPTTPLQRTLYSTNPTSSTSALAYKSLHRRLTPLPTTDLPPSWSAPAAVSSILYETPLPTTSPPKRHILNCLVQNEPGVLSRVSGILAARGFNIDSLVVCNTEVPDLSRMTIVLSGHDGVVEQARRQLEDLVPVWAVLDYTGAPLVQRELLLAKVSILGPEYFEELLMHHREMTGAGVDEGHISPVEQSERLGEGQIVPDGRDTGDEDEHVDHSQLSSAGNGNGIGNGRGKGQNSAYMGDLEAFERERERGHYHPSALPASQALRHKYEHLEAITHLTHQFGGKVLDISTNNCIVELSAKPSRIDSFMKLISPFGVLESQRTGLMALPRTPLADATEDLEKDAADVVDVSSLPPG